MEWEVVGWEAMGGGEVVDCIFSSSLWWVLEGWREAGLVVWLVGYPVAGVFGAFSVRGA